MRQPGPAEESVIRTDVSITCDVCSGEKPVRTEERLWQMFQMFI